MKNLSLTLTTRNHVVQEMVKKLKEICWIGDDRKPIAKKLFWAGGDGEHIKTKKKK